MADLNMQIAGITAAVSHSFGSTREYFRKYLSENPPDFFLTVTPEDRIAEQALLDAEADREGLRRRIFTDPFLERAVVQRKIAAFALPRRILLLHGSTVSLDGAAYLFTAGCGVGKSTHTRLWRQVFGAGMVNDDRAFLRIGPEGVLACGSPWSGKHGLDSNVCAPLAGICFLERGQENRIRPISPEEGLPELLGQAFVPEEHLQPEVNALCEALAEKIPLWRMACTKEPEAAEVAYGAMVGGRHGHAGTRIATSLRSSQ